MKKLFTLFLLAIAMPLMFTQCSDDKDDQKKEEPETPLLPGDFDPEDFITFKEISSADTTFNFHGGNWCSVTANWVKNSWDSEECYYIKLSKRAQQELLAQAEDKYGKPTALFITGVHCWPAASAKIATEVLKGNQTNFETVTLGQFQNHLVGRDDPWLRLILPLEERSVEIKGTEDFYVGIHAKNVAPSTFLGTMAVNDPSFPGGDAKYPSYAYCPNSETYLQGINDPEEGPNGRGRWNPADNPNFMLKVCICRLQEYN